MEDLKDIIVGKNFVWEGNLEDNNDSRVKIFFRIINSIFEEDTYKISVEIDKIAAKSQGYYSHINSFCNSGKDAINDREYLQMMAGIVEEVSKDFEQFGKFRIFVKSLNCADLPQSINEGKIHRKQTRDVVKDIIRIFKNENEGEYFLPEHFGGDMVYTHPNLGVDFSVELTLDEDFDANDIYVNGAYYTDDETFSIVVTYNPDNKLSYISELIGELNELITHELTHMKQTIRGEYDAFDEPENPYDYYTQQHELEAQYKGFKRKSKITKKPIEQVVDDWFEKYKEIHNLSDEEMEKVKDKIMSQKD